MSRGDAASASVRRTRTRGQRPGPPSNGTPDKGVLLVKFWFSVSRPRCAPASRPLVDPVRQWKLSPTDLASLDLQDAYTSATSRRPRSSADAARAAGVYHAPPSVGNDGALALRTGQG
ncbi:hypothetical protein [Streptomyces sp. H27-H1]|uniref:hypothetical protein n=1 Tax=Streptomyces sp. H27-H1 TaxID=2996461 RepID=UPI003B638DB2